MDLIGRYWHHILFAFVVLSIATVMAGISEFSSDFVKTASRKLKVNPTKYIFLKNAVEFIVYGRLVGFTNSGMHLRTYVWEKHPSEGLT
jgi:hypothetical protein